MPWKPDPFELNPDDLWPEFTYQWMADGGRDHEDAKRFGWEPVQADESPHMPAKNGVVSHGGMILLRLPEALREHWQKRTTLL